MLVYRLKVIETLLRELIRNPPGRGYRSLRGEVVWVVGLLVVIGVATCGGKNCDSGGRIVRKPMLWRSPKAFTNDRRTQWRLTCNSRRMWD